MITGTEIKNCVTCSKPLRGRIDKKFCDDYCRNSFNNQLKSESNNLIRNINYALKRNRRILAELLTENEKKVKVSQLSLLERGFQFRYLTDSYTTSKGSTYFFCYEYGYLPLENNCYLVVKRNTAALN